MIDMKTFDDMMTVVVHETAAEIRGFKRMHDYAKLDLIEELKYLYKETAADICNILHVDYRWDDDYGFEVIGRAPEGVSLLRTFNREFESAVRDEYEMTNYDLKGKVMLSGGDIQLFDQSEAKRALKALDLEWQTGCDRKCVLLADDQGQAMVLESWQQLQQGLADGQGLTGWQIIQDEDGELDLCISAADCQSGQQLERCEYHLYCCEDEQRGRELQAQLQQESNHAKRCYMLYTICEPVYAKALESDVERGLKKLDLQENMQSLTASQPKEDSLNAGLKNGGQGRH